MKNHINLLAPINNLGYGVAGTNIALALRNIGTHVALWPIGPIDCDERYGIAIQEMVNNQALYMNDAPSLRIWHQHSLAEHIGKGTRIGFPIFELDRFTERELHHLESVDKIFVCSR